MRAGAFTGDGEGVENWEVAEGEGKGECEGVDCEILFVRKAAVRCDTPCPCPCPFPCS